MKRLIDILKRQPLLSTILAVILAMAGIKLLDASDTLGEGVLRVILAMAMGFFLYLISGEKTLDHCGESTVYVIKVLSGFLIFSGVIGLTGFLGFFMDAEIRGDWPIRLLFSAFEMLAVGLFEEVLFRAVINDGITYQFRNFKYVWIICAAVSSLIFGWVHVISADVSEPLLMAQAVLKILTCAEFGLGMLFMYWKTRNIWGCALVHALFDFLPGWQYSVFKLEEASTGSYVNSGNDGILSIVVYTVEAVIMFFVVIQIYRKVVKKIDFEELRQSW